MSDWRRPLGWNASTALGAAALYVYLQLIPEAFGKRRAIFWPPTVRMKRTNWSVLT